MSCSDKLSTLTPLFRPAHTVYGWFEQCNRCGVKTCCFLLIYVIRTVIMSLTAPPIVPAAFTRSCCDDKRLNLRSILEPYRTERILITLVSLTSLISIPNLCWPTIHDLCFTSSSVPILNGYPPVAPISIANLLLDEQSTIVFPIFYSIQSFMHETRLQAPQCIIIHAWHVARNPIVSVSMHCVSLCD
jgi:hypothetical protein